MGHLHWLGSNNGAEMLSSCLVLQLPGDPWLVMFRNSMLKLMNPCSHPTRLFLLKTWAIFTYFPKKSGTGIHGKKCWSLECWSPASTWIIGDRIMVQIGSILSISLPVLILLCPPAPDPWHASATDILAPDFESQNGVVIREMDWHWDYRWEYSK